MSLMRNLFARRPIYLDYASATPVLPQAARAELRAQALVGNPGSIHAQGVAAKAALEEARSSIARQLGCKTREIVFTSGGTEANNLAILGFARAVSMSKGGLDDTHWIVSAIEHPSVLECFAEIERLGGAVDFVDPDSAGVIQPEAVERLLRKETAFVSIGWGNGEIGTIQPLAKIAHVLRSHEEKHATTVAFHTDAGQAPLYDAAHPRSLGVDLLTLDSGKLYGPRGVGALYLTDRATLKAMQLGGKQERGLRAGTENVALAKGFAAAFAAVAAEREAETARLSELREGFARRIIERIPGAAVNGALKRSLPHLLNISIPDINSEYVVLALDRAGISISTKSACREGEEQRSHVVEAITKDIWRSRNTLRFSLGRGTSKRELDRVIEILAELVRNPAARSQ